MGVAISIFVNVQVVISISSKVDWVHSNLSIQNSPKVWLDIPLLMWGWPSAFCSICRCPSTFFLRRRWPYPSIHPHLFSGAGGHPHFCPLSQKPFGRHQNSSQNPFRIRIVFQIELLMEPFQKPSEISYRILMESLQIILESLGESSQNPCIMPYRSHLDLCANQHRNFLEYRAKILQTSLQNPLRFLKQSLQNPHSLPLKNTVVIRIDCQQNYQLNPFRNPYRILK